MYQNTNSICFYVINQDQSYRKFTNYQALLQWLTYNERLSFIGHNWNDTYLLQQQYYEDKAIRQQCSHIIKNSFGQVLHIDNLKKDIKYLKAKKEKINCSNTYRKSTWKKFLSRRYKKNWLGFRTGPVPYIHKCTWAFKKGPRTTQELREWNKEYSRLKRSSRYLPNNWTIESDRQILKSWKHQSKRTKQWKNPI